MNRKSQSSKKNDQKELFEALVDLEKERGIPLDYMISQITKAIQIACKNTYGGNDDVDIIADQSRGIFEAYLLKTVVEEVTDPNREISLDKAREKDAKLHIGDKARIRLDPKAFGRIVIQTSRSIIRQGIRDGEKGHMLMEFQNKVQELVTATIEKIDPKSGAVALKIGKADVVLPKSEQVGNEVFKEGDLIKVYIAEIKETEKGAKPIISRTHPGFVKRLFETEVPEIYDGTVEIKAVSREVGSRTKLAVYSKNPDVDAVGACIGSKGIRVASIVNELGGEKIDIIEYNEDPAKFISAALSPASVVSVEILDEEAKSCRVTVPDSQLSLAIGNKGQNARLAARLTGWKIDIRPESGFYGEDDNDTSEEPETETDEIINDIEENTDADIAADEDANENDIGNETGE